MFLASKVLDSDIGTTPGRHRAWGRLSGLGLLLAPVFVLAGCGSGDGSPGPQISGSAIGVEGAHEHGAARMGLAVDGVRLTLDLQAPGDAVFGFEHPPESGEERAVVTEALARIQTEAGSLISLDPGLGCTVEDVEILEAPELEEEHEDSPHEEARDEGAHDEEADSGDEHAHSEVRARVVWSCTTSPEGTLATLQVARLLPDVEFVDLTVITSGGQAAGRVDGDAAFRF